MLKAQTYQRERWAMAPGRNEATASTPMAHGGSSIAPQAKKTRLTWSERLPGARTSNTPDPAHRTTVMISRLSGACLSVSAALAAITAATAAAITATRKVRVSAGSRRKGGGLADIRDENPGHHWPALRVFLTVWTNNRSSR